MSANPSPLSTPPVVILVRPQLGENIGAAARAMMNCGLHDLRLVAPRDGWPRHRVTRRGARTRDRKDWQNEWWMIQDRIKDSELST